MKRPREIVAPRAVPSGESLTYVLTAGRMPPSTRYQGSKRKLLSWIWEHVRDLRFHSVLDLFSGTASVSYLFKSQGKAVTANDSLQSNREIAVALVENSGVQLTEHAIARACSRQRGVHYDD